MFHINSIFPILLMIFILINIIAKIKHQKQLKILQDYLYSPGEKYNSVIRFKHDYKNILATISGYIEQEDIIELKKYFYTEILDIDNKNISNIKNIS